MLFSTEVFLFQLFFLWKTFFRRRNSQLEIAIEFGEVETRSSVVFGCWQVVLGEGILQRDCCDNQETFLNVLGSNGDGLCRNLVALKKLNTICQNSLNFRRTFLARAPLPK